MPEFRGARIQDMHRAPSRAQRCSPGRRRNPRPSAVAKAMADKPDGFVGRPNTSRIRIACSTASDLTAVFQPARRPGSTPRHCPAFVSPLWRTHSPGRRSPAINPFTRVFIFSRGKYFSSENRARRGIFRVKKIFVRRPLCADAPVFRGETPGPRVFSSTGSSPRSRHNVVHPKSDGKFAKNVLNLFDGLSGDSH